MKKQSRLLRIGVLGCGPIAQFAHFESCQKGANTDLYAICDAAPDLLERMNQAWRPQKAYDSFEKMLADDSVEAVIIAVSDAFHVPAALMAIQAGKHALIEKPVSHSIEECLQLKEAAAKAGVVVQIGHNKRFDPGVEFAHRFVQDKMGEMLALKAWYGDHVQRYTETDNIQPLPIRSEKALKPRFDEKADPERYYMMAHGSHLLDNARFFGGLIGSVRARLVRKWDAWCWFVDTTFHSGAVGHLDLTIKIRSDWHEGFQLYGERGSAFGKLYNPWYYKSAEVECYLEAEQQYYRPLGADGFSYRRQLEAFAACILEGRPQSGADIDAGLETVKGMIAIRESVRSGKEIYLDQLPTTAAL